MTFQGSVNFSQSLGRDALSRIVQLDETIGTTQSTTLYTYDAAGRVETATRDGSVKTYQYDDNGNRTAVVVDGREFAAAEYDAQDQSRDKGKQRVEPKAPRPRGPSVCRCTLRYAPPELTASCPDRVYGTGATIGVCQENAKMTAAPECRRYYGHCGYMP